MWLEFAIWGLVIFDEQTPWFTLVECVNILTHRHRKGEPLLPGLEVENGKARHLVKAMLLSRPARTSWRTRSEATSTISRHP
ncbi:MAG: hypothetical protein C3F11_09400 [Methylocystaceae bacterium]|nr:MAG: hypothetical protein C3F11_09400 [Methylocystaceae bacterium]